MLFSVGTQNVFNILENVKIKSCILWQLRNNLAEAKKAKVVYDVVLVEQGPIMHSKKFMYDDLINVCRPGIT